MERTRGSFVTGVDIDGYEVSLFCPDGPAGNAIIDALKYRMRTWSIRMNYAISREAVREELAKEDSHAHRC